MNIALFDFDGTITTKDSLINFVQFAVGKREYYIGMLKLSRMLITFTFKLIPNYIAKEKFISYFFKDWESTSFDKIAVTYSLKKIDEIIRTKAMEKINWHKEQGHQVVIVTASMESWLKGWCKKNGVDLIATKLESIDNKLTGKFTTKNCYGIEKVKRVKEAYDLKLYDYIYAYGDSSGDKELLAIADESFYKPFRN